MHNPFAIPAPSAPPKDFAEWEYYVFSVQTDLMTDGIHDAFVFYVNQGCHPGIAARRAIVQTLQLEADRLAIMAS